MERRGRRIIRILTADPDTGNMLPIFKSDNAAKSNLARTLQLR